MGVVAELEVQTGRTCGRRSTGRSARIRLRRSGAPSIPCGGILAMRLPVRLRLTIVFTLAMAVLLTLTGGFLYVRLGAEVLRTVDAALLSEADAVAGGIGQQGVAFGEPDAASAGAAGSFA